MSCHMAALISYPDLLTLRDKHLGTRLTVAPLGLRMNSQTTHEWNAKKIILSYRALLSCGAVYYAIQGSSTFSVCESNP